MSDGDSVSAVESQAPRMRATKLAIVQGVEVEMMSDGGEASCEKLKLRKSRRSRYSRLPSVETAGADRHRQVHASGSAQGSCSQFLRLHSQSLQISVLHSNLSKNRIQMNLKTADGERKSRLTASRSLL